MKRPSSRSSFLATRSTSSACGDPPKSSSTLLADIRSSQNGSHAGSSFVLNPGHAEDGNVTTAFTWPDVWIDVEGHETSGKAVRVNTRECMEYLTEGHDANKMLEDSIFRDHKELLMKFVSADTTVDLFDEKTWAGKDYSDLVETIHSIIAIRASQNQGMKS